MLDQLQSPPPLRQHGLLVADRRGAATEAARQLARLGFAELGLQRVEIVVDCNNLPSLRTAEKMAPAAKAGCATAGARMKRRVTLSCSR